MAKFTTESLNLDEAGNTVDLLVGTGDPNGAVTAVTGSLFFDATTPGLYQNDSGGTAWTDVFGWPTAIGTDYAGTPYEQALVAATNGDLIISPNGDGALIAQVPTGTTLGGDTRGQYATDWQRGRGNRNQVASGFYSTIGGGYRNRASDNYATVAGGNENSALDGSTTVGGGQRNTASLFYATIAGGNQNTASSNYATVAGGRQNIASGLRSFVGAGLTNAASGSYSTVGGGQSNTASGGHSTVGGGESNTASGGHSTVGGGLTNTASLDGATASGGYGNTASAYNSTVSGGLSNTASGNYSTVSGGYSNTASAIYATVSGGFTNVANTNYSTVSGGSNNTAGGIRSAIVGGPSNTTSGYASTAGGKASNVTGSYGVAIGGNANAATGEYSSIIGGAASSASHYGERAHASGRFANQGDAQYSRMILRNVTADATPTVITADAGVAAAANTLSMANYTLYRFRIDLVASEYATGDSAWWEIAGCIKRGANAAATALVGSTYTTTDGDAGAAAWTVAVTADTTLGTLQIEVTGEALKDIRWVATVHATRLNTAP